jgi:hypothetical protein
MVTMPSLKLESVEPSICSAEFDNIPEELIARVFNKENFENNDYGALSVEKERIELPPKHWNDDYHTLKNYFYPHVVKITQELIESDPIHYPFFHNMKDFKRWFDNHFINGPGNFGFIPIIDQVGFYQSPHIDNRFSFMAGIINIQENQTGTIFLADNKISSPWREHHGLGCTEEEVIYRASGKKHSGTFWLNGDNNGHAVPKVLQTRKILLLNLYF